MTSDAHGAGCQPMTFEDWCAQLSVLSAAEPHRYGPDAVESCGAEAWRDYFDNGYSPEDAWAEDGTCD